MFSPPCLFILDAARNLPENDVDDDEVVDAAGTDLTDLPLLLAPPNVDPDAFPMLLLPPPSMSGVLSSPRSGEPTKEEDLFLPEPPPVPPPRPKDRTDRAAWWRLAARARDGTDVERLLLKLVLLPPPPPPRLLLLLLAVLPPPPPPRLKEKDDVDMLTLFFAPPPLLLLWPPRERSSATRVAASSAREVCAAAAPSFVIFEVAMTLGAPSALADETITLGLLTELRRLSAASRLISETETKLRASGRGVSGGCPLMGVST